jgi:hypothetical protein
MYDLVYEQMVDAGVAQHLPPEEQYWVDEEGNKVDSGDKAAGHKCTIKLIHPDWCIYGDEVGTDTAQDDDEHIGGQTYLSFGGGERVNLTSSKTREHFTAMGLTAGTGEPIMCIIKFAAAEFDTLARLGYDHQSEIPYYTS